MLRENEGKQFKSLHKNVRYIEYASAFGFDRT